MSRRLLFGLLVAFGLLAVVYSLTTPLFEAPDEPWHYAYVRWLAEGHGLPRLDDDASGAHQEAAQPPLYYAAAALVSSFANDDDLHELFWHNPQFGYQAGGTVNDNKNMLIHTERERFPWTDAVLAVRLARFVSVLFGLLTVVATYGLTREVLPGYPLVAVAAAGVVAFTPQFLFMSSVVSNDVATAAITTLTLWALARIVRLGPTPRRAAVAGLALGLALLSKTSALLLLLIAVLALAMGWKKRATMPAETSDGGETSVAPWRETALMLGIALVVGGWWTLRNWILFDDPLGLSVHVNTPWGRVEPASLGDLLPELPQVFRSFWGAFGWGHVELPGPLYGALGVLVGLALVGWVIHFIQVASQLRVGRHVADGADAAVSAQRFSLSASAGMLLLAAGWCVVVLAALLRWMQQVEAPHGRLLFPALGAWGLLLAVGWWGLLSPGQSTPALLHPDDSSAGTGASTHSRIRRYSILIPVAGLFLLALVVPFAVIRPAFALPRLSSPEAATQGLIPLRLVYDGQARLLGYRVEPESVTAGGRVQVTLCWEALQPMDQDYTLFIHLLGRDNLRVGERTTYPGQGRFPTTLWPVGRAFCDSYWVEVAPWAPSPELYALEVGLYDDTTGWRLPAQDASGQLVEPPVVGLVRVTPLAPPPRPKHALAYDLGGQIGLVGYDSSTELANSGSTSLETGDVLSLTLYWEALKEPQGDYKVFVHLLDETGALVAQDDAAPRGGSYPTWAWQPGDFVPDLHQVTLPDERPPGPYYWWVGMYNPDTLDRLPVDGPEGPLPNGAIPLGEVRE
jgi:hypothetical protein